MNRIYRLVWNRARAQWVAASELAGSHSRGSRTAVVATLAASLLLAHPAFAQNVGTAGGNGAGTTGGTGAGEGLAPGGGGPGFGSGQGGGNGGNGGPSPISGGGGGGAGSGGGGGADTNLSTGTTGFNGGINGGVGGTDPVFGNRGGGGGGGGGTAGTFSGAQLLPGASTWTGGAAGNGAAGFGTGGGGGGGGGGGIGVKTQASLDVGAGATVAGGSGGAGGAGFDGGSGGGGGGGGQGIVIGAGTLDNNGIVQGGNGGAGGAGSSNSVFSGPAGGQGQGGEGVLAAGGVTITNNGTISGGLSADGTIRRNAITFTGGGSILHLYAASAIAGNVVAAGSGNTLGLRGVANGAFDVSAIGTQYFGFDTFLKADASTWTLAGTGAQNWQVDGGTLAGNANSLGGNFDIRAAGTLAYDASLPGSTHSGTITGAGAFVQAGSGTLTLLGDSSAFTGTTTVNGALQIGNGGIVGALGGNITNNGAVVFSRSNDFSYAGAISGSGTLEKQGAGMLTLTGNSNSTGTTTVTAGVLQVGDGGNTGALGNGGIVNNATLAFRRSDDVSVANDITGGGRLVQNGTGTLTLSGNNTYAGPTRVNAGTVAVTHGGASGTGTIVLGGGQFIGLNDMTLANSAVSFLASTTSTFAAATGRTVTATGAMNIANGAVARFGSTSDTGVVVMQASGGSIGTGTLQVAGGTLRAGSAAFGTLTGLLDGVTVDSGATLDANGVTVRVKDLQGSGAILTGTNAAAQLVVESGAFAGTISGSSSLDKSTGGTLVLTGANSYSGGTTIAAGTLQVGNGGGTGSLGGGAIANNGALVFDRTGTVTAGGTISGTGSLTHAGAGTVILAANNTYGGTTAIAGGTLQVGNGGGTGSLGTGAVTNNGALVFDRTGTVTVAGAISGTGSLAQAGAGIVILAADNSYSGATTIAGGTLQVGGGGNTGSLGTGAVANDGALVFARSDALTVANAISGTGSFQQAGAGTLILTGNSSYTGGTAISAGTLQIGNGGTAGKLAAGGVANNGTLAFNHSDAVTVANAISGTGSLVQAGAGTTVLTGANTYGGSTTIASGILQIGAGGASGTLGAGAVTNNGALAFNRSDALAVANAISGTGSLTQAGPGTTVLTGANSYSGSTTVSAGVLQVGDGGGTGSLGSGAVTNNGALVFKRSGTLTVANAISGTGTLTQAGPGTSVLSGNNSYSGTTTISAGTLQVGNGGAGGSLGAGGVTDNGALAFNRSDSVTLANVISGTGTFTQAGPGTLVLTGANTYTGGTFVNAGTLSVNGSIVGSTTINSGGTLGGTGTLGSIAVASGGTLAPGNSVGTLSAGGNLAFAPGSTYRVEANAAGAADRVNAVGASTITIGGGRVDVQAGGTGYQRNTAYTILSSGGATTGTFDSVTSNLAFLTPTLIYQANAVLLNLQASDALNYASVARTGNQAAVATYLGSFANAPGNAAAAALIQQIDNLSADQASSAFASMGGSPHASASQVAGALGRNFSASLAARSGFGSGGLGNAMNDWSRTHYASVNPARLDPVITSDVEIAQASPSRGVETPLASARERGFWAQALGAGGRIDSDGNGTGSRYSSNGLVFGYDQPVSSQWLAGGALGYSRSWWDATSGTAASGKLESPQAGLYARYAADDWRVRLDATYADHDFTTDRTVTIGSASSVANSSHRGREWGLAAQVERPIQMGDWQLKPLAGLRFAHLDEDGFTETGAGGANLTVADRTTQNTLLSAGVHLVRTFNQGKGGLELRAVASHLAGDNDSPVTASIAGQAGSFTADGTPLKRNALNLGATVSGEFARGVSAYLDANYEYRGSGQSAYQLTAGVRASF